MSAVSPSAYRVPTGWCELSSFRGRALTPVLEEPGVLIVGSQVPNLLDPGVAATLVVSQDVDVGVPVNRHAAIKRQLR